MVRHAFNLLAILSSVLCVGTTAVWLRAAMDRAAAIAEIKRIGGAAAFANALLVDGFTNFPALIAATALPPLCWVAVAAWARASRRGRLRSGRCAACDYDLTGNVSGVCPECGTPVTAKGAA